MPYRVLTQDEQDDIVVGFMLAQERDIFCHDLNHFRYTEMLVTLPPSLFRDKIQGLLDSTIERRAEVTAVIAETDKQMPDQARTDAARTRINAR